MERIFKAVGVSWRIPTIDPEIHAALRVQYGDGETFIDRRGSKFETPTISVEGDRNCVIILILDGKTEAYEVRHVNNLGNKTPGLCAACTEARMH